jgi:hypothetical protein
MFPSARTKTCHVGRILIVLFFIQMKFVQISNFSHNFTCLTFCLSVLPVYLIFVSQLVGRTLARTMTYMVDGQSNLRLKIKPLGHPQRRSGERRAAEHWISELNFLSPTSPVRLNLSAWLISHGIMFFSQDKSANSTFQLGFSAKLDSLFLSCLCSQ